MERDTPWHIHLLSLDWDTPGTLYPVLAEERDTPNTILLVVERDTPCMSLLLVVKRDTPCMSITLAVERDKPCPSKLQIMESDTTCTPSRRLLMIMV
jgi:hypothetical protein